MKDTELRFLVLTYTPVSSFEKKETFLIYSFKIKD